MRLKTVILAGIAAAMYAMPTLAHHSFSMFDADKKTTLQGTVKEFQWTNPHSWILMMVPDEKGTPQQWAIEMGAPGGLARQGWLPKTLKPGDRIAAVIHPLKDGTHGGQFMAVVLPNGKTMGDPGSGNGGGSARVP